MSNHTVFCTTKMLSAFLHFLQYRLPNIAEFLCTTVYAKDSLLFATFWAQSVGAVLLRFFDDLIIFQYLFGVFHSFFNELEKLQRNATSSPPCL